MQLPFTAEQFLDVFRVYNTTVWPAQIALTALAVVAVGLAAYPRRQSGPVIAGILALLWAWLGGIYHLGFFAAINKAAFGFGAISLVGAGVIAWYGIARRELNFRIDPGWRSALGLMLIAYALLAYPLLTSLTGHHYPTFPTFGLPCPTTLFTLGMLALAVPHCPRAVLVVPVLWCLVGAQAAFLLGVRADLGLIVAALAGIALTFRPGGAPILSPRA